MKYLAWLQSKKVTIGLVLGAIVLALAGASSIKRKAAAQRKEDKAVQLMRGGIAADVRKADRLIRSAGKDKDIARVAAQTMQNKLEKLSEANTDIDDIVSAFNSGSVRKSGKA